MIRFLNKAILLVFLFIVSVYNVFSQTTHYNLVKLLQQGMLDTTAAHETMEIKSKAEKNAITTKGLIWVRNEEFTKGRIDIDVRGKDIFLQSFLGVAFYGVDSLTFDAVYFRPFNFRHTDTLRRKWSVQYFSLPENDYVKLRKEHPSVYENAVTPVPDPNSWFHATIVIDDNWVTVYVDHSAIPSLKAPMLNKRKTGKIGLWVSTPGVSGDFANLIIKRQ